VGRWIDPLLLFGGGRGGRTFADNLKYSVAILRAVVMDLLAEMRDKAACRDRHCGFGIEFGSCSNPPGPRNNRDETVVGVEVRVAHMARMPLDQYDIETGFRRIAVENGVSVAGSRVLVPFDLIGQFKNDGGRVELSKPASCIDGLRRNCR
jgi:hypothetical protein